MWKEKIEKYIKEIDNKLISENEFLTIIKQICSIEDCPVNKVLYSIDREDPYGVMYIGNQSLISAHNSKNRIFTEHVKIDTINEITMCLEFKENAFLENTKYFENLFSSYWKPYAQRDINTLLMPIKQANIKSLLFKTIEEYNSKMKDKIYYGIGVGIEYKNFLVDLTYDITQSEAEEKIYNYEDKEGFNNDYDFDIKKLTLSFGYQFNF